jgi:hypothetical protein
LVADLITFSMVHQPLVGQDLLIVTSSQSHSDTPHSVRLLWTSDQPDADIYLTRYSTHNRQTPMAASFHEDFIVTTTKFLFVNYFVYVLGVMTPMGFEPALSASKRPRTHVLDRTATGIGSKFY